jgi:hypothetical protein
MNRQVTWVDLAEWAADARTTVEMTSGYGLIVSNSHFIVVTFAEDDHIPEAAARIIVRAPFEQPSWLTETFHAIAQNPDTPTILEVVVQPVPVVNGALGQAVMVKFGGARMVVEQAVALLRHALPSYCQMRVLPLW